MLMRRAYWFFVISLSLTAGISILGIPIEAQKKEELPHPKALEELQRAMKDIVEKNDVTGAGVAIVSNGQLLWWGGIGKAAVAANRDVTCATKVRVGASSEKFVEVAVLGLEDEG